MKTVFILLICLVSLCSCQKKSTTIKQTIRLNIATEPPTMDARKASDTTSIALIKMCFEGLMRRTQDGSFENGMAERVEVSDDQKTYTFFLRNAKWSDGHPVRAQDFEETWKLILSPEFPSPFSNDLYILKNGEGAKQGRCSLDEVGVKSLDAKTLQVTLEHPSPYIYDLISMHAFLAVPSHITKDHPNWAEDATGHFVCNGPFNLTNWRHHNQMLLEKNDLYWDKGVVSIEKIDFTIIPDENTELNMFESGQLDWAGYPLSTLPIDAFEALKNRMNIFPLAGVYYYIFNVKEPPFDNVNLRRAFTLAINRQEIIENITQMGQTAATAFVPTTISHSQVSYFKDNDYEEASRLFELALKEMNLSKETLPPIVLTYNTMAAHHRIAQAIAQQWRKIFGIKVELKNMEWKVFLDELTHKQFTVARMGGVAAYNDPIAFLHLFRYADSTHNLSGWTNETFSALLNEADLITDQKQRKELLEQAEKIFLDEMPIAPIYFYTGSYMQKPYLKNVALSEFAEIDFKYAYLEKGSD